MKLTEYTSGGYDYVLVVREGDFAIFKGTKPDRIGSGLIENWEVIKIQINKKAHTFPNGSTLPVGHEHAPSANQWGDYGWTVSNYQAALDKLSTLTLPKSNS